MLRHLGVITTGRLAADTLCQMIAPTQRLLEWADEFIPALAVGGTA